MLITGGLFNKIKVINVVQSVLDIQTSNLIELEIKIADIPHKYEILQIAKMLQKIPFLYDPINVTLSNTILIRYLLYNPALYPIVIDSKQTKPYDLYTRSPIVKKILDINFNIFQISEEESLWITGLSIDTTKQGSIVKKNNDHDMQEYLEEFETHDNYKVIYFKDIPDINILLIDMLIQLKNATDFYLLHFQKNISYVPLPEPNIKKVVKINSWYSPKEVDLIKFLLQSDREWTYNLDPLQYLGNDLDKLLYIITEGPNSDQVKDYFVLKEMKYNKEKKMKLISKEDIKITNMAKRYIIIIGNKLGSVVQQKVLLALSKSKYLRMPGGSMAIPIISSEINNPNTILNLLSVDQQNIVKIEYDAQEKYMLSRNNNTCPHLNLYQKLIKAKNADMAKNTLLELSKYFKQEISSTGYYICINCNFDIMCSHVYDRYKFIIENIPLETINTNLFKYAIKVKVNKGHEYYCKYCGEKLLRDFYIEDEIKFKQKVDLSENSIEIRNYIWSVVMSIIISANIANEKTLAIYISNTIRPLVESKVGNVFDDNVKFICIIYVTAFILIIMKNHKMSFLNIDPELQTSKIAEKLLNYIYSKYNSVMKYVKSSTDIIRNEFMLAYKTINSVIGTVVIPVSNPEIELSNFILNLDPIYKYAKKICILLKKIPFKLDPLPNELKKEFETILGNSLPNIIKSAKDNIKNPLFSNFINKRLGSILQVDKLDFFHKDKVLNIYNDLIAINNGNKILNDFINGNYDNYTIASYILFHKFITEVSNENEYNNFRIIFDKFKKIENEILLQQKSLTYVYDFNFTTKFQFVNQDILLTSLYDENGNKHDWSIYYYGTHGPIPKKKLQGPKPDKLIDVGCSICNVKKTETNKLDLEKTKKAVKSMSDLSAFFMFYKTRCPVKDLHIWLNDTCTTCDITINMLNNVNANKINSEILSYYNKYLTKFLKEVERVKKINTTYTKNIESNITLPHWEYNHTPVVKVSQLTKININIIESIGLTENRIYSELENGINIPELELYHIYSAFSELIFVFSKFIELTNKQNIDQMTHYNLIINDLIYKNDYKNAHKFIIQTICELILIVPEDKGLELFDKIIKNQKMLTAPIMSFITDDSYDVVYLGDDIADSGEDLRITQKVKQLYYSAENIDYDFTEDNPNNELNIEIPNEYIYNI